MPQADRSHPGAVPGHLPSADAGSFGQDKAMTPARRLVHSKHLPHDDSNSDHNIVTVSFSLSTKGNDRCPPRTPRPAVRPREVTNAKVLWDVALPCGGGANTVTITRIHPHVDYEQMPLCCPALTWQDGPECLAQVPPSFLQLPGRWEGEKERLRRGHPGARSAEEQLRGPPESAWGGSRVALRSLGAASRCQGGRLS